ncbi:MAG TPA: hypothetical protein VNO52_11510, partial [Methylomirabilota bacterium]|nr:hypothetical protein [Methylomirabilota bacterium]
MAAVSSKDRDWQLVQQYLSGETEALAEIKGLYNEVLHHTLVARGATPSEAEDLVANLWSDCVIGNEDRPSLLEKFSGRCSLQGWLLTVATNRLIDFKRRQAFQKDLTPSHNERSGEDPFDLLPGPCDANPDTALVELLRDCLQEAFGRCSPEELLLLRLVYLHGITQREVGRMMGW